MKLLDNLRKLDDSKKKLIILSVVIVLGIAFFILWLKVTTWRLSGISKDQLMDGITMPNIELPEVEIPTLPESFGTDTIF
ncbi:MAG: hypothetical protein WC309_04895 [Candidatus Paceibacterota bacterium]|jgi:hypothetical protein|nr:hypothetical protein [Candidatus Paceibacterota bacterium]